jgi:hypothetical protein
MRRASSLFDSNVRTIVTAGRHNYLDALCAANYYVQPM